MPRFVCGSSTSWAPSPPSRLAACSAPLLSAGSRRVTGGSSLRCAQRTPSGLRSPLPTPTLLQGLSPRDQEGLSSSDSSLPDVPPPVPRRSPLRFSQFPQRVLPSPDHEWLGLRIWPHEACSAFDACGPPGRSPTLGRICQEAPRLGFPAARLLSFMLLAPFMLGLSPTGLSRLLLDTA